MLLRPTTADLRAIVKGLSLILGVVAVAGILPLGWAIARAEWAPAGSLLLMVGLGGFFAAAGQMIDRRRRHLPDWGHGLVVVALAWLLVPAVGSIPLALSGHYGRWLDAYFDSMSGLTTTGLALVQDVDHLADSLNVWRHTLQFLGGQGIVLAALMFFSATGALSLFQAEGRDERIFPSVASTARFIWLVSALHAAIGIPLLTLDGALAQGFGLYRASFHALTLFMAAFDTGGFTPQSTSIGYYHSALFEVVISLLMVAGAMSFGLHHAIWQRRQHLGRNLEVRTILVSFTLLLTVTMIGLAATGVFTDAWPLLRRGFFQTLSAHTGTGFATVSTTELARWSGLAFAGIAVAMALGGMSSSTAGGVKSLRVGLTVRAIIDHIREALLPEKAIVSRTYRQYGVQQLTPRLGQSVMTVSLLFVALYLLGAAVGVAYGFPLQHALFESISASAAVGLSVGVVSPGMPIPMEIVMIGQMWIGRLEFIAVFALIGFVASWMMGE